MPFINVGAKLRYIESLPIENEEECLVLGKTSKTNKVALQFVVLLLVFTLMAVGCTGGNTGTAGTAKSDSGSASQANQKSSYMLGTASTGGYTYLWGAAACTIINKYAPKLSVTAQITTGGGENIARVIKGEMPLGVVGTDWIDKYYNGKDGVPKATNLRAIYSTSLSGIHVIVRKDAPYKNIYDLKGKKVAIGNKGGSTYESAKQVLDILGIGEEGIKAQYLTMAETVEALKAKTIDGWIVNCIDPHSSISEASTMPGGIKILPLSKEDIEKIQKAIPYYAPAKIESSKCYSGIDYDVDSIGRAYYVIATTDFPEEEAYQIAKALHENYKEWCGIVQGVAGSTLEQTVKGTVIPLHPGVERYAKEAGIIK